MLEPAKSQTLGCLTREKKANVMCFLKSILDQNLIMSISNLMVILKTISYLEGDNEDSSCPYRITLKKTHFALILVSI
jgi:hypothetical protein